MAVQKAVVMDGTYASVVTDRPIPKLRPGYVLVQVKAVGLNPTDWKSIARTNIAGATLGCDFAGVVEETGEGYEKEWKVGDRIAGIAFSANHYHHEDGAYAEHILARADVSLRIPDDMSFEEAATLGVGMATCGQGLFSRQGLRLDGPANPNKHDEKLFIYGGSTATAALRIQLAILAGYKVYTVSSPQHFDTIKSLGAIEAFDYNDSTSTSQLLASTKGEKFTYIWDTITQPASVEYCMKIIQTPHGHYRNLSPLDDDLFIDTIDRDWTLAYTTLGEPVKKGVILDRPDTSEDFEDAKNFIAVFEQLLHAGKIRLHPYTVSQEGLDGVHPGLKMLSENKVGRRKLVYTL